MNQQSNIIVEKIQYLENIINEGAVDIEKYAIDLKTLKRIEEKINALDFHQCNLMAKQLKVFNTDTLKQIEEHISNLKDIKPLEKTEQKTIQPTIIPQQYNEQTSLQLEEVKLLIHTLTEGSIDLKNNLNNITDKLKNIHDNIFEKESKLAECTSQIEYLTSAMKQLEEQILKVEPAVQQAKNTMGEHLTKQITEADFYKKHKEHQEYINSYLQTEKDTIVSLCNDTIKKHNDFIDAAAEYSANKIKESSGEVVEQLTSTVSKKQTNLLIYGLLGFFVCSLVSSAFTAKLVANRSSNTTIEYITKLLNAAADKNKNTTQQKQLKNKSNNVK